MSNRRKPAKPAKSLATSYEAHTPAVRLLRVAAGGNNDALREHVARTLAEVTGDQVHQLVAQLARQAAIFADRLPARQRDQLVWELDNAEQLLAGAMRQATGGRP